MPIKSEIIYGFLSSSYLNDWGDKIGSFVGKPPSHWWWIM